MPDREHQPTVAAAEARLDGNGPIEVFGPGLVGPGVQPDPSRLAEAAKLVLVNAIGPGLRDDRFPSSWPPDDLVAAVEFGADGPVGYLGGTVDRGRLQLDGLLVEGADQTDEQLARAERLWQAMQPALSGHGIEAVELWGHPARPWHGALATSRGLAELRALHQLRCTLPVDVEVAPLETRPFQPDLDEAALIRVNNRAFASHPDQGGMTIERLAEAAAQPWFDPDGIRLFDGDQPGVLAGFCWTKIHEPVADGQPRLGEIYAIGIDPDHHGDGLGVPMTAAGLDWLAGQGLTTGMLYVEADNEPALRTYARLGFDHHRTDRAWWRAIGS